MMSAIVVMLADIGQFGSENAAKISEIGAFAFIEGSWTSFHFGTSLHC